ncbi:outer membrane beta-barrel family protein [Fulvivirga maritima]|uniref:outer membrane beta-barrel family protein n=1 Tax=Fulvivirga maritima TaxID=2904247 RepID=UPI001F45B3FD|nr:outer membrane beta-barrel family protein [Fulvivirga maritima]UII26440.1 outer membrane beta-barrel family protein [Fulvivirga maritima]
MNKAVFFKLFFTASLFFSGGLYAQNLESVGKENPLTITGGVSVNQIGYSVNGIESRRDPYSLYASGNVNFNLYGWSVPFTFTYSNQQTSFQQPFNQYGLHPTYKWITGHFGYASMNFSSYTLAGHLFLGAGIEANPGKFQVSAMYGRLLDAVEPDSLNSSTPPPSFKRMGYGLKAGYADGNDQLHVILFGAKDDVNSISYVPENEGILPEENLVMSLIGSKQLFEKLILKAEYAVSGLTRDSRADEVSLERNRLFGFTGGLFTPRQSSTYYTAFNTNITYQGNGYAFGVGYEKIDPGYKTLGAYYFNNDLENITVNGNTSIFKGKVNIGANVGIQHDNLDDSKVSTMRRVVGALNVGYAASEKLNLAVSYSNFQTYTNIRSPFVDINELTPYDNLDTLDYTQISQNASLNANYILQNERTKRQNLNLNLTFQDASDQQGGVDQNSGNQFYMANAAYSLSLVPQNLTVSASFNYNQNESMSISTTTMGPTLGVRKSLLDKQLRLGLSSSLNQSYTNGSIVNRVTNVRGSGSYSIKKKHSLNLSVVMVNRKSHTEGNASDFTEFTATLGYSYNFSTSKSGN